MVEEPGYEELVEIDDDGHVVPVTQPPSPEPAPIVTDAEAAAWTNSVETNTRVVRLLADRARALARIVALEAVVRELVEELPAGRITASFFTDDTQEVLDTLLAREVPDA